MSQPARILDGWLSAPWHIQALLAFAVLCLVAALLRFVQIQRLKVSARRMVLIEGRVRLVDTVDSADSGSISREVTTVVDVAYTISGRAYRCRRYELFGNDRQSGDGAVHIALTPGTLVMVKYDPRRPHVSALTVGKPQYAGVAGLLAMALLLISIIGWLTG
jgi:hypothetical protein